MNTLLTIWKKTFTYRTWVLNDHKYPLHECLGTIHKDLTTTTALFVAKSFTGASLNRPVQY